MRAFLAIEERNVKMGAPPSSPLACQTRVRFVRVFFPIRPFRETGDLRHFLSFPLLTFWEILGRLPYYLTINYEREVPKTPNRFPAIWEISKCVCPPCSLPEVFSVAPPPRNFC